MSEDQSPVVILANNNNNTNNHDSTAAPNEATEVFQDESNDHHESHNGNDDVDVLVVESSMTNNMSHDIVDDAHVEAHVGAAADQNLNSSVAVRDNTHRGGTISSACFNLLSTMVGGGSLSLPLAFQQSGNGLLAPLILIATGIVTQFTFGLLIASAPPPFPPSNQQQQQQQRRRRGTASYESVASSAFGPYAHILSTVLVCSMCFFGTVGYAVLLRDMLEPISDMIWSNQGTDDGPSRGARNMGMLLVVVLVTPLCGLETLTSLEKFGATSMISVLVLGTCVVIRSYQCVFSGEDGAAHWDVQLWPSSPRLVLDAVPLFISCFVCHYNIHPVHNDLQNPTPKRVTAWLRWTTWSAVAYYMTIGFSGSLYAACTPDGHITGNILLSFDDSDPLLLVGRLCLALTITLAFPMLTIPARDIILRALMVKEQEQRAHANNRRTLFSVDNDNDLEEPLLMQRTDAAAAGGIFDNDENVNAHEAAASPLLPPSILSRMVVAVIVFWSGAGVACCVSSIDVVWDLLGSSLSILLSFLIPFGSYLMLTSPSTNAAVAANETNNKRYSRLVCWILLGIFIPLMFISTGNAILNTFFPR